MTESSPFFWHLHRLISSLCFIASGPLWGTGIFFSTHLDLFFVFFFPLQGLLQHSPQENSIFFRGSKYLYFDFSAVVGRPVPVITGKCSKVLFFPPFRFSAHYGPLAESQRLLALRSSKDRLTTGCILKAHLLTIHSISL